MVCHDDTCLPPPPVVSSRLQYDEEDGRWRGWRTAVLPITLRKYTWYSIRVSISLLHVLTTDIHIMYMRLSFYEQLEKVVSVSLCSSAGVIGGIFSPSHFMGTALGLSLFEVLGRLGRLGGRLGVVGAGRLGGMVLIGSRSVFAITGAAAFLSGVFK